MTNTIQSIPESQDSIITPEEAQMLRAAAERRDDLRDRKTAGPYVDDLLKSLTPSEWLARLTLELGMVIEKTSDNLHDQIRELIAVLEESEQQTLDESVPTLPSLIDVQF